MVLEYLLVHFQPLFEYTYTKTMEEQLDNIAHGRKVWSELCKECATDLDGEIRKIADTNKGKEHIRIDNEHSYMMGKYGPVLKCTDAEKNVTFKPVNPDLDLEKLRTGAYALADVVLAVGSDDKKGRSLGVYGEKEVVLRSGKFGWYLEWGTEKKALKITLAEATALTMDDVIETLYDLENGEGGVIRVINKETSIRKGKGNLADYIFHKNKKMKKPKFLKLTGFKENYRTCDINILHAWLKKTYDINQPTPS
jgi:DNA topoisomerase-1